MKITLFFIASIALLFISCHKSIRTNSIQKITFKQRQIDATQFISICSHSEKHSKLFLWKGYSTAVIQYYDSSTDTLKVSNYAGIFYSKNHNNTYKIPKKHLKDWQKLFE